MERENISRPFRLVRFRASRGIARVPEISGHFRFARLLHWTGLRAAVLTGNEMPGESTTNAGRPALEERVMEHDFVYCPRCTRYSVVHWQRELGHWECEDCAYHFPQEEDGSWTTRATLAS